MSNFKLTPLDKLVSKQPTNRWLIKDHMEEESIGMLFGAPASAKSFIAMDIAYCIAAGVDWNGNDTLQGKVVYLAGEGFNGMSKRFKALGFKYKTATTDVFLSEMPASLSSKVSAQEVYDEIIKICPKPILIIVDTLHRNFGPGDENSAKDFGEFLLVITTLMRALGTAILLVHHSGHSAADRGRGSSSIKAALDVEYKISKTDKLVTMVCTKAKEFEEPKPISFNLVTQPINDWLDVDGLPTQSAVLQSTTNTMPSVRTASITNRDNVVLKALSDAIVNTGKSFSNVITAKFPNVVGKKFVPLEQWRTEAYLQLNKDSGKINAPATNQQAFSRSKVKLLSANKVAEENGCFWEVG